MKKRTKSPSTVAETETMRRLKERLKTLKLFAICDRIDDVLDRVSRAEQTAAQALMELMDAEVLRQQDRRIERRIRESKLPERPTLANFEFEFQPTLDKHLVMELHTMDFVSRRQGVILAGQSGTGKSHLAKALALQGCKMDYRVRYTTAAEMLSMLFASLADDSLPQKLKRYTSPELLVIDELGFDRLEREDARNAALFFKVIDGRYNRLSTVLTTNIDFEQLGYYLGDPVVTTAIVDRMVHHSTVITINGPSYRMRESEALNKQQQKKAHSGPKPSKAKGRRSGRSSRKTG